jgi:hypothetical protein
LKASQLDKSVDHLNSKLQSRQLTKNILVKGEVNLSSYSVKCPLFNASSTGFHNHYKLKNIVVGCPPLQKSMFKVANCTFKNRHRSGARQGYAPSSCSSLNRFTSEFSRLRCHVLLSSVLSPKICTVEGVVYLG